MNFRLRTLMIGVTLLAAVVCIASWCIEPSLVDPAWFRSQGPLEPLAGSYYFGDGLGTNCTLELRPASRFKFTWTG